MGSRLSCHPRSPGRSLLHRQQLKGVPGTLYSLLKPLRKEAHVAGIQGTGERKPHCSPPPARVAHTSREPYGTAKRGERQPCALQLCCSHYKHTIFLANDPSQALPKSAGRCLDTRLAPAAGQHHGEGALELLGLLRCPHPTSHSAPELSGAELTSASVRALSCGIFTGVSGRAEVAQALTAT